MLLIKILYSLLDESVVLSMHRRNGWYLREDWLRLMMITSIKPFW